VTGLPAAAWAAIAFMLFVVVTGTALFVGLLIHTFAAPANCDWHLTYVLLQKTDIYTGARISGYVMRRKIGGKKQYRALEPSEARNSHAHA
jgi:hypothetical protein